MPQASPVARIPDTDPSAGRAAALSIDNIAGGFELSALQVSLVFTAIVIGVVSTGSCAASAGSRRQGPRVRSEPLDYRRANMISTSQVRGDAAQADLPPCRWKDRPH